MIVGFAGREVADLYEYTYALRAHAPGDRVEIVVLREGGAGDALGGAWPPLSRARVSAATTLARSLAKHEEGLMSCRALRLLPPRLPHLRPPR